MGKFDPPLTFGDWLKQRRMRLDLTQGELAQSAGCSVFALRKIESGERRPSKQLAGLLAGSLDIPPDYRQIFIRVARGELNLERLPAPSFADTSQSTTPSVPAPPKQPLPIPATPLVGRQAEMIALGRIFTDQPCRLLTLIGLGGIGKTRLALEFAVSQEPVFPGGIFYVPLASLHSPELIVPAIAEVFGLTFSGPTAPKEQLLNYLANHIRQVSLLLLDNLEHLLHPHPEQHSSLDAADLVAEILERLPNLRVLATSRERLNLRGEWMFELQGLPVPPLDYAGELDNYGASALFILSARRAKPEFDIKKDEHTALIRICHLLQGIPLAIELSAAWVEMLDCQEIAREIETNLDLLTTTLRDVPERHRSIRASFDHSWKLLPEGECRTLRRLSVFHGGFSRQAAEQITGASLPLLTTLHAKSLVRITENGRYDLHEVILQFVLPYFASDPEHTQIRDRHAEYFLMLVRDREKDLKSALQQEAIQELTGEIDNIRAAWSWALQRDRFILLGWAIPILGWFYDIVGWLREGIEQLELVIQALRTRGDEEENTRIIGQALTQLGSLYFRQGRFEQAQMAYEESLVILRPIGDPALLASPLYLYGILLYLMGDIDRGEAMLEEGLTCAKSARDQWFEAYAIFNLGHVKSLQGRYAEGYEQMLEGIASWRQLGDPRSISLGLNFISPTAIRLGYLSEAQAYLEESLSLSMQVGDRWGMGTAYRLMGLVSLAQGDAAEAQSLIRRSLAIFREYIGGWDIARSLANLGEALSLAGDLLEAERTYLESLRIAVDAQTTPVALEALAGLARLQLQAGELERAYELAYFVLHHSAATFETEENASLITSTAEKALDDQRVHALQKRAGQHTLTSIVEAFNNLTHP